MRDLPGRVTGDRLTTGAGDTMIIDHEVKFFRKVVKRRNWRPKMAKSDFDRSVRVVTPFDRPHITFKEN